MLSSYILQKAVFLSNDENYDKTSIDLYGLWNPCKLYLHLYKKNQIIMNYDIPLEYFDGKTAYEMSKIGYSKIISQQKYKFTEWLNGDNNSYKRSTDINTYSPVVFGLYYSSVEKDVQKDDFLENIIYYKDQKSANINISVIFIIISFLLVFLFILVRKLKNRYYSVY